MGFAKGPFTDLTKRLSHTLSRLPLMKKGNRRWERAKRSVSGMLISGDRRKITGHRRWEKEQVGRDIEDRGKGEIKNGISLLLHPPLIQKVVGRWHLEPKKRDPSKITRWSALKIRKCRQRWERFARVKKAMVILGFNGQPAALRPGVGSGPHNGESHTSGTKMLGSFLCRPGCLHVYSKGENQADIMPGKHLA